jgi:hypothetical protein
VQLNPTCLWNISKTKHLSFIVESSGYRSCLQTAYRHVSFETKKCMGFEKSQPRESWAYWLQHSCRRLPPEVDIERKRF